MRSKRNGESPSNEITYYSYNAVGSLELIDYANGNTALYTYDSLNRLTELVHYDDYGGAGQTQLAKYQYELADDGMRTGVTEVVDGNTTTIAWTYDALNRLTKETYDSYDDANDFIHSYVYGLVGNRLEKQVTGGDTTYYYYNDNDQLTQETTADANIFYTYNTNGSLIEEANDTAALHTYTYNYLNRMASASDGTTTVDYM